MGGGLADIDRLFHLFVVVAWKYICLRDRMTCIGYTVQRRAMLPVRNVFLVFVALAFGLVNGSIYPSSPPHEQKPTLIRSRISQRTPKHNDLNDSISTGDFPPPPQPDETVGEYFDKYAQILDSTSNTSFISNIKSESELTSRSLVRSSNFLESLWSDDKQDYNISISKCVLFSQTVGPWTASNDSTIANATLEDINNDLQRNVTTPATLSKHLQSRLLANAILAATEAESFLNDTICDYESGSAPLTPDPLPSPSTEIETDDSTTDLIIAHDELRKLLTSNTAHALDTKFFAVDGYWTGILMSMGAGAAVGGSLYKGFYNHNATATNVAVVCFAAAGLIMMRGIIERWYMNGSLRFVEASVLAAFTSWFRQAVAWGLSMQKEYMRQVGADQQESGCLEEAVIEGGVGSLPGYSNSRAGVIELIPMGGPCF